MSTSGKRLLMSAKKVAPVSRDAAREYSQHKDDLVRHVNRHMLGHPEKVRLIGEEADRLMMDNHRHHVEFMENVFLTGTHELMSHIVPWVYRAYTRHGFSADYFPVALRVWKEAVGMYLKSNHAREIHRVYDWMIEHHSDFVELSHVPLVPRSDIPAPWQKPQQMFLQALLSGDDAACVDIADRYVSDNQKLMEFYQYVLAPAMYDVGSKWESGDISVAREHLASSIVARTMSMIYLKQNAPRGSKGTVIVTAASNEYHEIGAWVVANSLQMDDWRVLYLGSNTPNEDLLALVREEKPFIVAISIAMPFNLEQARKAIAMIREEPAAANMKIMVGGQAVLPFPDVTSAIGADGNAPDAAAAVQLANQWLEVSR